MLLRRHADGGSISIDPFDFVVIGAGSAGAVVAARLSESPDVSVLLIEAGPDHTSANAPDSIRGANFFAAVNTPGRIWPNLVATRAAGQTASVYVRGRGVGGSSSVNAMGAIRGLPDDYDRWVVSSGAPDGAGRRCANPFSMWRTTRTSAATDCTAVMARSHSADRRSKGAHRSTPR